MKLKVYNVLTHPARPSVLLLARISQASVVTVAFYANRMTFWVTKIKSAAWFTVFGSDLEGVLPLQISAVHPQETKEKTWNDGERDMSFKMAP